jgi:hypothetical protein
MQKWEYGDIYVTNASAVGKVYQLTVVADANGNRILKNAPNRLAALNILGALGWIIFQSPYMSWQAQDSGWLFELIKSEKPEIRSVQITHIHFMRKPQS